MAQQDNCMLVNKIAVSQPVLVESSNSLFKCEVFPQAPRYSVLF